MKKLLILPLIALISCGNSQNQVTSKFVKNVSLNGSIYSVYLADDSCEYMHIRTYGYYVPVHYAQCSYCKNNK